jgi:hypothetical protein
VAGWQLASQIRLHDADACALSVQLVGWQTWAGMQSASYVHCLHDPQSAAHVSHVSHALQMPSPHARGQVPQSAEHVAHVSVPLHAPSPQVGGQAPQSAEHVAHVSVPLHAPSPHAGGQAPQSVGQLLQFSLSLLHNPSPQAGLHRPQSTLQFLQCSFGPQTPSPQPFFSPNWVIGFRSSNSSDELAHPPKHSARMEPPTSTRNVSVTKRATFMMPPTNRLFGSPVADS